MSDLDWPRRPHWTGLTPRLPKEANYWGKTRSRETDGGKSWNKALKAGTNLATGETKGARVAGAQRGGRRTVDVAGAAAGAFRPQRALWGVQILCQCEWEATAGGFQQRNNIIQFVFFKDHSGCCVQMDHRGCTCKGYCNNSGKGRRQVGRPGEYFRRF